MRKFKKEIEKGYTFKGPSVVIGTAMLDGEAIPNCPVRLPLRTFNRHGLIAGKLQEQEKTKTLQNVAERLSGKMV